LTAKSRRRRKVDPRQVELEDAIAASAGDAEKGYASTLKKIEHSELCA
jgi:hypothetical protein